MATDCSATSSRPGRSVNPGSGWPSWRARETTYSMASNCLDESSGVAAVYELHPELAARSDRGEDVVELRPSCAYGQGCGCQRQRRLRRGLRVAIGPSGRGTARSSLKGAEVPPHPLVTHIRTGQTGCGGIPSFRCRGRDQPISPRLRWSRGDIGHLTSDATRGRARWAWSLVVGLWVRDGRSRCGRRWRGRWGLWCVFGSWRWGRWFWGCRGRRRWFAGRPRRCRSG